MTPAMQREVEKLVKAFAEELLGLYREAVIASLAMTGSGPRAESAAPARSPRAPRATPSRAKKARSSRKGRPLVKSSPEEVEALSTRIIDYIKKSGKRPAAKDIQAALKVEAGPFQYALNKLKADGRVRQVGQRRMARYEANGKVSGKTGGRASGRATAGAKKPRRSSAKKVVPTVPVVIESSAPEVEAAPPAAPISAEE